MVQCDIIELPFGCYDGCDVVIGGFVMDTATIGCCAALIVGCCGTDV